MSNQSYKICVNIHYNVVHINYYAHSTQNRCKKPSCLLQTQLYSCDYTKCMLPTNTNNTLRGTEIHSKANKHACKQAQTHALSTR